MTSPPTIASAKPAAILAMLAAKLVNASPDAVIAMPRPNTSAGAGTMGSSIHAATAAHTPAPPTVKPARRPIGAATPSRRRPRRLTRGARGAGATCGGAMVED